jgi:hypothetical protein
MCCRVVLRDIGIMTTVRRYLVNTKGSAADIRWASERGRQERKQYQDKARKNPFTGGLSSHPVPYQILRLFDILEFLNGSYLKCSCNDYITRDKGNDSFFISANLLHISVLKLNLKEHPG